VLHLTVTDQGGAGAACIRLHRALLDLKVDSRVLVRKKVATDDSITQADSRLYAAWRFRLDRLPLYLYPRRNIFAWWSVNWLHRAPRVDFDHWEPDIVHTHWIGDGYVPLEWLARLRKPVVWTMHDMWPLTGGCHYTKDCDRYQTGCGACPQLGSTKSHDLSSNAAARKARAWKGVHGTLVAPSHWLGETARRSAVMKDARVEVIPYGLDGNVFRPGGRAEARNHLGLDPGERILLTGAVGAVQDERKGFRLLVEALRACWARGGTEKWRLLVFGADDGPGLGALGISVKYCGMVRAEKDLARIYQAADAFALPSIQDNLPNTALESFGCGKPVVGFRSGGLATMIEDGRTGWLAEPFSASSLAAAIHNAMGATYGQEWNEACRHEFERLYAWPGPAHRYLCLYEEMLKQPQSRANSQ
jgi:glycosyltransferase involved in cell wall biosynthesis